MGLQVELEERRPSRPRTRPPELEPPDGTLALLALQRHAGNAAVAGLFGASGGRPLPGAARARMEDSFGTDFAGVRIHEGPEAAAIGAQALTRGDDIHFAQGRYRPETAAGAELLGHELAHVVQQRAGRVTGAQAHGPAVADDPALEREADHAGAQAARGRPAGVPVGAGRVTGDVLQGKFELAYNIGAALTQKLADHDAWEKRRKEEAKRGPPAASVEYLAMSDFAQQLANLHRLTQRTLLIETDNGQRTLQQVNDEIRIRTQVGRSRLHLGLTQNKNLPLGLYTLVCTHPDTDRDVFRFELAIVARGEDENAARVRDAQQQGQKQQDVRDYFDQHRDVAAAATPKFRQDHVSGSPASKAAVRSEEREIDNTVVYLMKDSQALLLEEVRRRNEPPGCRSGVAYTTKGHYIQIDSKGWFVSPFVYGMRPHDDVMKIHHYERPLDRLALDGYADAEELFERWNARALKDIRRRRARARGRHRPGPAPPGPDGAPGPALPAGANAVPASPQMKAALATAGISVLVGAYVLLDWLARTQFGEGESQ